MIKINRSAIEHYQRNLMLKLIKNFNENDLIIISDCYKIPAIQNLENKNRYNTYIFIQKMFYYKFNLQLYKKKIIYYQLDWSATIDWLNKHIVYPQEIRDAETLNRFNIKAKFNNSLKLILNGGWHYSLIYAPELIKKKIKSNMRNEIDTKEIADKENIKKTIENKKDNLKKKIFIKKKIVITFLKFILNQKKLLEFIEK